MIYNNLLYEEYRDYFSPEKEDEITVVLVNINGLRVKGQHAKNDLVYNFILGTEADIIALQEVNINWNLVPWRDRQEERLIG